MWRPLIGYIHGCGNMQPALQQLLRPVQAMGSCMQGELKAQNNVWHHTSRRYLLLCMYVASTTNMACNVSCNLHSLTSQHGVPIPYSLSLTAHGSSLHRPSCPAAYTASGMVPHTRSMGTKGRSGSEVAASRKVDKSRVVFTNPNPTSSDVTLNSTSLQSLMMSHPDLEDVQEDMVQEYR